MKAKIYLFLIPISLFLIYNGCKKDKPVEPPPQPVAKDTITVTVEQVTHRSVTIGINKKLQSDGDRYHLYRVFESTVETEGIYSITGFDTTIIDDNNGLGLLLDTTYSYFVVRFDSLDTAKDSSNTVTAKTLAPTTHDYTWQEITIGEWQSDLRDVWGTDENNVYAVGNVKVNGEPYGVLKWNGSQWDTVLFRGGKNAIYGFSENDIWIAGGGVYDYNGIQWIRVDAYSSGGQLFPLDTVLFNNKSYTAIWGTSSNNIYLGNEWGKVIHWDGEKGSETGLQSAYYIQDIWGFSENDIYVVAGGGDNRPGELYHFDGSNWTLVITGISPPTANQLRGPFLTFWGFDKSMLFLGGGRIYTWIADNWFTYSEHGFLVERIRGNNANDVFAGGHFGGLAHYNGVEWQRYLNVINPTTVITGIYTHNDHVYAVGYDGSVAYIYHGIRN